MLRRFPALVALLAVAATPALAQSRLVCRTTGELIADCVEESCHSPPAFRDAGCCERRATPALPAAHPVAARGELLAPVLTEAPVCAPGETSSPGFLPLPEGAAVGAGPPIFLATRALLI